MSYSPPITIFQHNGWKLDSYGNGAAYALSVNDVSVFFQGEDAAEFRNRFDAADKIGLSAIIWLFHDYSDVMSPA